MCEMANDMKHESVRCKFWAHRCCLSEKWTGSDDHGTRLGLWVLKNMKTENAIREKTWSKQVFGQNTAKLIWLIFRGKRGRARKGKSSWSSARCPVRVSWSFHIFRFAFLSNVLLQPLQLATNTKTGGLVQLTTFLTVTPTNKNSIPLLLSTHRRSRTA